MKKIKKMLLAGCLFLSAFAVSGTAVAIAENDSGDSRNLGYAPDITVNWGDFSPETVPDAVKDMPYQVFTAEAEDVYGNEIAVKTRVYLHYYTPNKTIVSLKNHTVTPVNYGFYTVEYTAKDEFGNANVVTYDFSCDNTEKLSVSIGEIQATALAGTETQIADYTYENEIGFVTTKITATHTGGKAVYDLTGKTSFVPLQLGEYTIEYACTDYNLTVKESYTLVVEKNENPVFLERCNMPKYFIVGKKYTLPKVAAYQFSIDKPVPVDPLITVKVGKDKVKELDGYEFIPEKEGDLKIVYTIFCGENSQTQEYSAHAVDVGEVGDTFDIANYFYSTTALLNTTQECVHVLTETDGAKVDFIQPLFSRSFSFDFAATLQDANFKALNLYLKDSQDESVQLKITYGNPGRSNAYISVNDGRENGMKVGSFLQTIAYDEALNAVKIGATESVACPNDFKGFPSGKIYFSFELSGVKSRSAIDLYAINNHMLLETGGDDFAPQIFFDIPDTNKFRIGDLITLSDLKVGDVLDSDVTVAYDVFAPDETNVISEEGVLLQGKIDYTRKYTFRATQLGEYRVRVSATDSVGNRQVYAFVVSVEDLTAPTVTLREKLPTELKVGEILTVSDIMVKDDLSTTFKTSIVLIAPMGEHKELAVGGKVKFTAAGVYKLYYMVTDESDNTTTLCYTITVW